jgi:surface antigen
MQLMVLAAALALGGCASTAGSTGSVIGRFAPGGSETGNRAQAILAAMGDGLVGGAFASPLAERDRLKALEAEYKALEYSPAGQAVAWKGESGDPSGEVTAYQPYRVGSQDCRQYTHSVISAGQSRSMRGTACRNEDGSWTPLG